MHLLKYHDVHVTFFTGPALRLDNEAGYPHFGRGSVTYEIDATALDAFLDGWLA
jgi:hypothetical protein